MGNIGFYRRKCVNPNNGREMYTVRLVPYSKIDKETATEYACNSCGISRGHFLAGLAALSEAIEHFVLRGHSISIDGLGNFRLTAKSGKWDAKQNKYVSAGVASLDDATPQNIKSLHIRFRPCRSIREELNRVKFFDVGKMAKKQAGKNWQDKHPHMFFQKHP